MTGLLRDHGSGLYLHIPFCLSKCSYCGFYSKVPAGEEMIAFLDHLEFEAEARFGDGKAAFSTVFVGGGNPVCLGIAGLQRLEKIIRRYIIPDRLEEWTFEANPETLTTEILSYFSTLPAIRLSIGVQRLCDSELQIIGRKASLAAIYRALDAVFSVSGLTNVGIDLILGVPGGNSVAGELRNLINCYALQHVSAYFLTLEPGTPLEASVNAGIMADPQEVGPEELFQVRDVLVEAGFEHYEISNYARSGYRCRHNLNYWQPGNYSGLGPSAVSTCADLRLTNPASLSGWLKNEPPAIEQLSPIDRRNEYLMLRLRLLQDGLDVARLEKRFGSQSEEFYTALSGYIADGLLCRDDSVVRLTDKGLIVADEVMAGLFI
jgi:oxygen-independent coproporphyrinogen-3 oxidase